MAAVLQELSPRSLSAHAGLNRAYLRGIAWTTQRIYFLPNNDFRSPMEDACSFWFFFSSTVLRDRTALHTCYLGSAIMESANDAADFSNMLMARFRHQV